MLAGIIPCHPMGKVGGYAVTFVIITAISCTEITLLYHVEGAYAGIQVLTIVPSTFFGSLILQLCKSRSHQFEKQLPC